MGLAEDVVTSLSTALGLVAGGAVFAHRMPDAPSRAIAVFETGGLAPTHTLGGTTSPAWKSPAVQVISRSTSAATARADITTCYDRLDGHLDGTLPGASSGNSYMEVRALQEPFLLGEDDAGRIRFAVNFLADL